MKRPMKRVDSKRNIRGRERRMSVRMESKGRRIVKRKVIR